MVLNASAYISTVTFVSNLCEFLQFGCLSIECIVCDTHTHSIHFQWQPLPLFSDVNLHADSNKIRRLDFNVHLFRFLLIINFLIPHVVFFYLLWCCYCQRMHRSVGKEPRDSLRWIHLTPPFKWSNSKVQIALLKYEYACLVQ